MRNYDEFSQDHCERIQRKLDELAYCFRRSKNPFEDLLIENTLFTTLMRIHKKTTQYWRDKGLISYSQDGEKYYYRVSEIRELLNRYHMKANKEE